MSRTACGYVRCTCGHDCAKKQAFVGKLRRSIATLEIEIEKLRDQGKNVFLLERRKYNYIWWLKEVQAYGYWERRSSRR